MKNQVNIIKFSFALFCYGITNSHVFYSFIFFEFAQATHEQYILEPKKCLTEYV